MMISTRKRVVTISEDLCAYLRRHGREVALPLMYEDLLRYGDTTPVYDKHGRDTLWETVLYPAVERSQIATQLVETYAMLKVKGDTSLMRHLVTDRVDVCSFGNTQPFRVRILNTLNENFDYFYVKRADASRVYGLELEHILSPNRIAYLSCHNTIIEEHISGIPGDVFCRDYLEGVHLDEVRLAKEFVKFNERCFIRLLGDMHSGNFVVDMTPDFDETVYRIRAIDFDQQCYEPRCSVYLPQYYKENNPIIFLGMRTMTSETTLQYREEERTLTRIRAESERTRIEDLLTTMAGDVLAPTEHVEQLASELSQHYNDTRFLTCSSMGALVRASLRTIEEAG
jgi:hypothetical protein